MPVCFSLGIPDRFERASEVRKTSHDMASVIGGLNDSDAHPAHWINLLSFTGQQSSVRRRSASGLKEIELP